MNTSDLLAFWGAVFTRIGAILLIVFGVRILINLYKYNMRMSAFYESLADSMDINGKVDDTLFALFKHLYPDKIDFERQNKMPMTKMLDIIKDVLINKKMSSKTTDD